jgi:hypothetical protein
MPKVKPPTRPIGLRQNAFHRYRVTFDVVTTAPILYMLNEYYEAGEKPLWSKFLYMMRLFRRHSHGDNEMVVHNIEVQEAELK